MSRNLLNDRILLPYEAAICGSISGGIAAAFTTPLDVLKTRIMLGKDKYGNNYTGIMNTIARLVEEGRDLAREHALKTNSPLTYKTHFMHGQWKVFFAGIEPRVMWITIGGFVFFGAYELALQITQKVI